MSALAISLALLSAAPMGVPRVGASAQLLTDGRVLVAGGSASTSAGGTATSELYDPARNAWTMTGSMATGHSIFATVRLRDGGVISLDNDAAHASEIYSPSTASWSPFATPTTPRQWSPLVWVGDRILSVGGDDLAVVPSEKGDALLPGAIGWTALPPMPFGRTDHAVTSFGTGVVVIGGRDGGNVATDSVLRFDLASNSWTPLPHLIDARNSHASVLLRDGDVLVVGGYGVGLSPLDTVERVHVDGGAPTAAARMGLARARFSGALLPSGEYAVFGGDAPGGYTASIEIYDPVADAWRDGGFLVEPKYASTATILPSGRVLVAGGAEANQNGTTSADVFDPSRPNWSVSTAAPSTHRDCQMALLPSGRVLVFGGEDSTATPVASAMIYERDGGWTAAAPMSVARARFCSAVLDDGRVLAAGDGTAEIYDEAADGWAPTAPMLASHDHHACAVLRDGRVLAVGSASSALTEVFDPATNGWSDAGLLPEPRYSQRLAVLGDGSVLLPGGYSGQLALRWSAGGGWSDAGVMSSARYDSAVKRLPDGRVLVAAGRTAPNTNPLATSELFNPATGAWSAGPSLPLAVGEAAAVELRNGRLLLAGGANAANTGVANAALFEPGTDVVLPLSSMPKTKTSPRAVVMPDGRAFLYYGGDAVIFDEGRDVPRGVGPRLEPPAAVQPGQTALLAGTGFIETTSATNDTVLASSSDFPFVSAIDANGNGLVLPPSTWAETSAQVPIPATLPIGGYWVTVTVNGVPSDAQRLTVGVPPGGACTTDPQCTTLSCDGTRCVGIDGGFPVLDAGSDGGALDGGGGDGGDGGADAGPGKSGHAYTVACSCGTSDGVLGLLGLAALSATARRRGRCAPRA